MSLADRVAAGDTPQAPRRDRTAHPAGYEPGFEWTGAAGFISTGPSATAPTTDTLRAYLAEHGIDPATVEILEPFEVRGWDATQNGETVRHLYYKIKLRARRSAVDVDELVKRVKRSKIRPLPSTAEQGGLAYVVAAGDLQLGKPDGDGTAGTVDRFCRLTELSLRRLRELKRRHPISTLYLPWLGDCIEGTQSQGGRLVMRLELTPTEQVRLYRRLLLHQVEVFAPHAERIVVPVVPGNHDEAFRIGDQQATRADDSWAIEGASAVADALKLNPDAFGHVSFAFPKIDELTLTLDVAGTIVGFAHGHQFRPGKAMDWWAGQAHGMQPIGDATLLMTAHYHYLDVREPGAKTHVQIPALEGGSAWWVQKTGQAARPGMVTMLVGGGDWSGLEVLR